MHLSQAPVSIKKSMGYQKPEIEVGKTIEPDTIQKTKDGATWIPQVINESLLSTQILCLIHLFWTIKYV